MYLNVHSCFSLRYGTMTPQTVVETAVAHGLSCLALTDINSTACTVEFITRCDEAGIKPVVGVEFRAETELRFIGLARNKAGFDRLNRLLTSSDTLPAIPPRVGASALSPDVWIIYPRLVKPIADFAENEFLGIRPEHVNRLWGKPVLKYPKRLVAWSPVTLGSEDDYPTHRLLRAIDQNLLLSQLEAKTMARPGDRFYAPEEMQRHYRLFPFLLENSERLLETCHYDLRPDAKGNHNRRSFGRTAEEDYTLLETLTWEGIQRRYGTQAPKIKTRVEKELRVVRQQGYCAYYLITWDAVQYAKGKGYAHIGRGSGANSIIAYAIGISDVDPLALRLPFERFLNEFRASPPDFDVDFSHTDRDDVIDYLLRRYGTEHAAMLATYGTFKDRSIIREVGKVYGLPKYEIDRIVADPYAKDLHPLAAEVFAALPRLRGLPSHLGIHAGGIVISERPLTVFTALKKMPKGVPITHFDMYHGEDWGFHKFDILSQRGLGHIKDAVDLVRTNRGEIIDIHQVEPMMKDPKVIERLRSARCIGCFYIESPAMRQLLTKLQCDNYLQLVAASSIIRPGVASSGMMAEYIKRRHAPDSFSYLHHIFEEELQETYGVMVYQEDVMKIAHAFAGLPLTECDVLRRIMSGKKAKDDTFERLRGKFFAGCAAQGHAPDLAQEVWRQISSFAGYSFCKAHSASYAVESFQSLYLKTYYPLEFIVGVINNFGGFYQTEYYVHEARMGGATIHAPCVNHSDYFTSIKGDNIYLGFVHLLGLETQVGQEIINERERGGAFRDFADFARRVTIRPKQFDILIRIDAFRFTGRSKYELAWEKNRFLRPGQAVALSGELFSELSTDEASPTLPILQVGPFDQAFDEIELLGFPLCSPFALLIDPVVADRSLLARDLPERAGQTVEIVGYYVCKKKTQTKHGQLMSFGTWLDVGGAYFDTVHFPETLREYPINGKAVYRIRGKVVIERGFATLEVKALELLPLRGDARYGSASVPISSANRSAVVP